MTRSKDIFNTYFLSNITAVCTINKHVNKDKGHESKKIIYFATLCNINVGCPLNSANNFKKMIMMMMMMSFTTVA